MKLCKPDISLYFFRIDLASFHMDTNTEMLVDNEGGEEGHGDHNDEEAQVERPVMALCEAKRRQVLKHPSLLNSIIIQLSITFLQSFNLEFFQSYDIAIIEKSFFDRFSFLFSGHL